MKRAAGLLLVAGLALVVVLVARSETDALLLAFATLGLSGFTVIIVVHLALIGLMGLAWAVLMPPLRPHFIAARLLRDAASEVLPLSQLGGFVLGARALVLRGVSASDAAALTVVDVTAELVAQLLYTLLGVALLAWLRPGSGFTLPAISAVAAMSMLAFLFAAAQRGGAGFIDRLLQRAAHVLLGRADGGAGLGASLARLHQRPSRVLASVALHGLAWGLVGGETWLMLHLMALPVGLAAALVIDSLVSGLRSMAFMVPQALGVQEGGYVMLGAVFGVTPEAALALSLLRRARDLAIGIPALLAWQTVEAMRSTSR